MLLLNMKEGSITIQDNKFNTEETQDEGVDVQAIIDFVDLVIDEGVDELHDDRVDEVVGITVDDDRANDKHEKQVGPDNERANDKDGRGDDNEARLG